MENRLPDGLGRRGYWVQKLRGNRGSVNSAFESSREIPATSNCRATSISSSNQRNRPAQQDKQELRSAATLRTRGLYNNRGEFSLGLIYLPDSVS